MPRRRLTESYWKFYLLSLFEKSPCCFSIEAGAGDIIVRQWMRVLFLQHLHQHWLFPVFFDNCYFNWCEMIFWHFWHFFLRHETCFSQSHQKHQLIAWFCPETVIWMFPTVAQGFSSKSPIFAFMLYYCHLEILRAFWTSHWHPTLTHQFHFTLTRPHKSYFQAQVCVMFVFILSSEHTLCTRTILSMNSVVTKDDLLLLMHEI